MNVYHKQDVTYFRKVAFNNFEKKDAAQLHINGTADNHTADLCLPYMNSTIPDYHDSDILSL